MSRLGFLVPPGNPTVEPEMVRLAPRGTTVHFTRMVAHGEAGAHAGQEERNRSQIAHLDDNVALLAMVKPAVIVMAHTASSYTLGREGEAKLVERLERASGIAFITAFGSVIRALAHLGARRVALATPYSAEATRRSKAHLEAHDLDVVAAGQLQDVRNIYEETPERAYELVRRVDVPEAQAVFISGVGMPSIDVLERLERELRKPVISSASAMMWNALRVAQVSTPVAGYGSLLAAAR
jgi:maleate isomerase